MPGLLSYDQDDVESGKIILKPNGSIDPATFGGGGSTPETPGIPDTGKMLTIHIKNVVTQEIPGTKPNKESGVTRYKTSPIDVLSELIADEAELADIHAKIKAFNRDYEYIAINFRFNKAISIATDSGKMTFFMVGDNIFYKGRGHRLAAQANVAYPQYCTMFSAGLANSVIRALDLYTINGAVNNCLLWAPNVLYSPVQPGLYTADFEYDETTDEFYKSVANASTLLTYFDKTLDGHPGFEVKLTGNGDPVFGERGVDYMTIPFSKRSYSETQEDGTSVTVTERTFLVPAFDKPDAQCRFVIDSKYNCRIKWVPKATS